MGQYHPALLLLLRHQRHSFLHLQQAQKRAAELAFLLSQRSCLEVLRHRLVRRLLYPFQPLLHLYPEALRHLLVLLRPLCHYFLRP
jgi:hypothetical protein